MPHCANCGSRIDSPEFRFCPECGAALPRVQPETAGPGQKLAPTGSPEPAEELAATAEATLPPRRARKASAAAGGHPALIAALAVGFIVILAVLWVSASARETASVIATSTPQSSTRRAAPTPTPPPLEVYQPQEGSTIVEPASNGLALTVTGWTQPGAKVTVEVLGTEYPISNTGGNFTAAITLPKQAVESIKVTAVNEAGSTEKTIHVRDPASGVPNGYYETRIYGSYSNRLSDLRQFLWKFVLPRGYETEVFDCSESAAMLEWALESSGFSACIVTGPCPWDPKLGLHAWVIVQTGDGEVAVEPTALVKRGLVASLVMKLEGRAPGIIYSDNPSYSAYRGGYNQVFADIYAAARADGSLDQWNWWEGRWGFR